MPSWPALFLACAFLVSTCSSQSVDSSLSQAPFRALAGKADGGHGVQAGGAAHGNQTAHGAQTGHADGHGTHPHVALLFPFVATTVGILITHMASRSSFFAALPYTVSLLIVGSLLEWIDFSSNRGLGTLSESMNMWRSIDPHLLLYAFLPILLFGDSMTIIWHEFRRSAAQCAVLAGPGVLIGTAIMFVVAKYVFPYGWTDYEAAAFASILAATDPVAVVGLLKEMGASKVLTMQISGESLLNDGVALVVWTVFFEFMNGKELRGGDIVVMFLRLAGGGTLFGAAIGFFSARWMSVASNPLVHSDNIVQVALTITVAYLTFFIGENELRVSGVLASIFAAVTIGKLVTPLLADPPGMGLIWHMLEFFANTVLFFLCGVITATAWRRSMWEDLGWLLLLYLLGNLARGFMIFSLSPIVNCVGGANITRTTWKECLVMTWGGLRGAVGLALALSMRNALILQGKQRTADLMVFHVSGFAALTLLVNATTCGALLKTLELTKPPEAQAKLLGSLKKMLAEVAEQAYKDSLANDGRFKAVHSKVLDHMLQHMRESSQDVRFHSLAGESHEDLLLKVDPLEPEEQPKPDDKRGSMHGSEQPGPNGSEEEPEVAANSGETGATENAEEAKVSQQKSMRRPPQLVETGHWWWGFNPIEPAHKYKAEAGERASQVEDKRLNLAYGGEKEEYTVYRRVYLSMLRAEYLRLIEIGLLPKRCQGASMLIASVDGADDFADMRLNDWKMLKHQLFHGTKSKLQQVVEILSPYFTVAPVDIVGGLTFDLFTVVCFIDAHHAVADKMVHSSYVPPGAKLQMAQEAWAEVEAAHDLLVNNGIGAFHISRVRTMQLATFLFEVQKEQVKRWRGMGLLSEKDMEELLHLIKHGADHTYDSMINEVSGMTKAFSEQRGWTKQRVNMAVTLKNVLGKPAGHDGFGLAAAGKALHERKETE